MTAISLRKTGKIVYVLSDVRSGSTLLDQLLGGHVQAISLGEIHHLVAYAVQDRAMYNPRHPLNCSCGNGIDKCVFWKSVEKELGRPLKSLQLKLDNINRAKARGFPDRLIRSIVRRLAEIGPKTFSNPLLEKYLNRQVVAEDSFELYDAIFRLRNVAYLIDSSKSPLRFRALYEYQPKRMIALILARDYRGTVYSKMKRGSDLRASASSWAARLTQIKQFTFDVPERQILRVRYEDLCIDPRKEMTRLCSFLNLDFSDDLLSRPTDNVHHLGGSPSKFDSKKKAIKLDESYVNAFSNEDLAIMKSLVGTVAREWGYD